MGCVLFTFKISGPVCDILNNQNEGLEETLEDPLDQVHPECSCYVFV